MGRYYSFSDGQEGKFWLGVQPSDDVMCFGGNEYHGDYIRWQWSEEDLPAINRELTTLKYLLSEKTTYTYRSFMRKISNKRYIRSTADGETNTPMWAEASRLCSKIQLGLMIRRGVRKQGELSVEAET